MMNTQGWLVRWWALPWSSLVMAGCFSEARFYPFGDAEEVAAGSDLDGGVDLGGVASDDSGVNRNDSGVPGVRDGGEGCADACDFEGQTLCDSSLSFVTCELGSDGCLTWSSSSACPGSEFCGASGRCEEAPSNCDGDWDCPEDSEVVLTECSADDECSSEGVEAFERIAWQCLSGECVAATSEQTRVCWRDSEGLPCDGGSSTCRNDECTPNCVEEAEQTCMDNAVTWLDSCGGVGRIVTRCENGEVCQDYGDSAVCECVATTGQTCIGGDVYGVDSCGGTSLLARCEGGETCQSSGSSASCVCTTTSTRTCSGGDVYAVDSCGNTSFLQDCTGGRTCQASGSSASCVCTATSSRICSGGDVYAVDSCGNTSFVQDCTGGQTCRSSGSSASCVCTTTSTRICSGGDVYAVDSCGNTSFAQDCTGGQTCQSSGSSASCVCTATSSRTCSGGDAWTLDSCGGLYRLYDDCTSSEICSGGSCVPSCTASSRWSPNPTSEVVNYGTGDREYIYEPIEFEVTGYNSGTMQLVVTKQSGDFQNDLGLIVLGASSRASWQQEVRGTYNPGDNDLTVNLPSALHSSLNEGEQVRYYVQMVSPARCRDNWGAECAAPSVGCGTCWYTYMDTMTRTCR